MDLFGEINVGFSSMTLRYTDERRYSFVIVFCGCS